MRIGAQTKLNGGDAQTKLNGVDAQIKLNGELANSCLKQVKQIRIGAQIKLNEERC